MIATTEACDHGPDRLTCPVAACNPMGANDPFGPPLPTVTVTRMRTDTYDREPWPCANRCGLSIIPGDPITVEVVEADVYRRPRGLWQRPRHTGCTPEGHQP